MRISFDDFINSENNELDVKKNFACVMCNNVVLAPVMQCDECEMVYCSSATCLNGVKKCQNLKCPKQKAFSTTKLGRIVRNVMSNFEFNHVIEGEETVIQYEKKCKLVLDEYKSTLKFKCSKCNKDNMTLDELKQHLKTDC